MNTLIIVILLIIATQCYSTITLCVDYEYVPYFGSRLVKTDQCININNINNIKYDSITFNKCEAIINNPSNIEQFGLPSHKIFDDKTFTAINIRLIINTCRTSFPLHFHNWNGNGESHQMRITKESYYDSSLYREESSHNFQYKCSNTNIQWCTQMAKLNLILGHNYIAGMIDLDIIYFYSVKYNSKYISIIGTVLYHK